MRIKKYAKISNFSVNQIFLGIRTFCHVGAESPNERQGAFSKHLKCTKHPGYELQSCSTQKVGFSKWRPFFDSMHFWTCSAPSGGFLKKEARTFGFHLTRGIWYIF